jgi:hypothetical protein
LHRAEARCVGEALCGLQNLGCLASLRKLFCGCTRWLIEEFLPLPRYDLLPQMGETLVIPYHYRLSRRFSPIWFIRSEWCLWFL